MSQLPWCLSEGLFSIALITNELWTGLVAADKDHAPILVRSLTPWVPSPFGDTMLKLILSTMVLFSDWRVLCVWNPERHSGYQATFASRWGAVVRACRSSQTYFRHEPSLALLLSSSAPFSIADTFSSDILAPTYWALF